MRYLIAVLVVSLSCCGPDLELLAGDAHEPICAGHVTACHFDDAGHPYCVDAGYRSYPLPDGGTCGGAL